MVLILFTIASRDLDDEESATSCWIGARILFTCKEQSLHGNDNVPNCADPLLRCRAAGGAKHWLHLRSPYQYKNSARTKSGEALRP